MSATETDGLVITDERSSHGLEKNCKDLSTLFAMFLPKTVSLKFNPKQMGQIGWKKNILNSVHASVGINH